MEVAILDEEIGQRIRELRLAKGWPFDRLARETGLSRGTLWEAERKEGRVPWHSTLQAIADALEVPVEYLRTGKMPAEESNLSDFSPDVYGRAKGLTDPVLLAEWSRYLDILKRIEWEATRGPVEERGPDSFSASEFARAHGLQDEENVAKFESYLERLLELEALER